MSKHFTALFAAFALLSFQSTVYGQPVRKLENVTTPAASECLSPEHAGLYGGFKNRCDFAVQYTWCVVDPGPDDWSSTFACVPGRKTNALDSVQAKATSANHTKGGKGVQWFACAYKRETATGPGPDGIWGPVVYELGIGLRGRCALRQYADPTTAQIKTPPAQLQQPVTAASSQAELAIMLNERKQWRERNPNHLENSKITFEESMQYALLYLGEDLRILQTHRARLTKAAYDQERNNILANMDGFTKTCRAVSKTPASCVAKYPAAWRSLSPPVRRAPQALQAATPPKPQVARQPSATDDPIWAACGEMILEILRNYNPPDTSPATVQRWREAWSYSAMGHSWGSNSDGDILAEAERQRSYIGEIATSRSEGWRRVGTAQARARICQLTTYVAVRRK